MKEFEIEKTMNEIKVKSCDLDHPVGFENDNDDVKLNDKDLRSLVIIAKVELDGSEHEITMFGKKKDGDYSTQMYSFDIEDSNENLAFYNALSEKYGQENANVMVSEELDAKMDVYLEKNFNNPEPVKEKKFKKSGFDLSM